MEETEITRSNLDICPNCLEPNESDLANCKYCGMPLHPEAVPAQKSAVPESEDAPAPSDTPAAAPEKETKGQRSETFSRVMKYMGLYIIYLAIDQLIQVLNTESSDRTMGIIASLVYMIAGIMLAYPLLKEWFQKLMHKIRGSEPEIEGSVSTENVSEETSLSDEEPQESENSGDPQ